MRFINQLVGVAHNPTALIFTDLVLVDHPLKSRVVAQSVLDSLFVSLFVDLNISVLLSIFFQISQRIFGRFKVPAYYW